MRRIITEEQAKVLWYKNKQGIEGNIHIQIIRDYPEVFDISKEEYNQTFQSYNEPVGTEGKARLKILNKVMRRGWIRIRYRPELKKWFIEVFELNRDIKRDIKKFIEDYIIFENVANYLELWNNKGLQFEGSSNRLLKIIEKKER